MCSQRCSEAPAHRQLECKVAQILKIELKVSNTESVTCAHRQLECKVVQIQSSYLSKISHTIFVEKIVMLRNFGEILGNFEKIWEILGDIATIYALSC